MELALVVVIGLALVFAYVNGFHDAASTIATPVSTRALTPAMAIALAVVFNLIGALLGQEVAYTIGSGIVSLAPGAPALLVVGAALAAAVAWDLLTWLRGIPTSSSHALIGALTGAGLIASLTIHWDVIAVRVVVPMLLVPLAAMALALVLTTAIIWLFRESSPSRSYRRFENAQAVSAAALALAHGISDGQKAIGAIMLAMLAAGHALADGVPLWVRLATAVALALGTASGGWRIVRTLGRRLVDVDAPRGFAAELVSAVLLYVSAFGFGAAVSTTHTVTGAVVGAGAVSHRFSVRTRILRDITVTWLLTPFVTAALAALIALVALPVLDA